MFLIPKLNSHRQVLTFYAESFFILLNANAPDTFDNIFVSIFFLMFDYDILFSSSKEGHSCCTEYIWRVDVALCLV